MTEDELRDHFKAAYRIIQAERKARLFVFRDNPARMKAKVSEMDKLLWIVTAMKDELKHYVASEPEQGRLLDESAKYQ